MQMGHISESVSWVFKRSISFRSFDRSQSMRSPLLDPLTIRYHLEKATYLARSGRSGPVWVDIPLDIQASPLPSFDSLVGFDIPSSTSTTEPMPLASVIEGLNQSERPLIFIGNGVRLAHAEDELTQLLGKLDSPVAATWCAADLVSSEDPLFVGRPGTLAARGANFALQNCDFLLTIGVRLDFAITGYAPDRLARAAYKVVVDIDPAELRKLGANVQLPIESDARNFITALLNETRIAIVDRSAWLKQCAEWKTKFPIVNHEHRAPGPVSVYNLAEVISKEVDPSDLIVSGSSGSAIEIFLFAYPTRRSQRIFHTAGLGAMGFGLPASIGVALAGAKRTICVDGDGGFQFNIQELETVARLNLPIKFFILNNGGYDSIRNSQRNYFGKASIGCDAATGMTIPKHFAGRRRIRTADRRH